GHGRCTLASVASGRVGGREPLPPGPPPPPPPPLAAPIQVGGAPGRRPPPPPARRLPRQRQPRPGPLAQALQQRAVRVPPPELAQVVGVGVDQRHAVPASHVRDLLQPRPRPPLAQEVGERGVLGQR